MVASTINQRHCIIPFAELCTPACPHPYPLLVIMLMFYEATSNHTTLYLIVLCMSVIDFGSAAPLIPSLCLVPSEYGHILVEHAIVCRPSLDRMDVVESAVVLHWQGTDSSLKPVLCHQMVMVCSVFLFSYQAV